MAFTNGIYARLVEDTITVQANGEDISAGQFVILNSGTQITEGANLDDKVQVAIADAGTASDSASVIGIALTDITNGNTGTVATKGIFDVKNNGTSISAGNSVKKAETTDAYEVDVLSAGDAEEKRIGKALTPGTVDNGAVTIKLNI